VASERTLKIVKYLSKS